MLSTMVIEVTNEKAMRLITDLEELNLIRVIKQENSNGTRLSEKYRGVFSKEDADSFLQHSNEMRKEWDNT